MSKLSVEEILLNVMLISGIETCTMSKPIVDKAKAELLKLILGALPAEMDTSECTALRPYHEYGYNQALSEVRAKLIEVFK